MTWEALHRRFLSGRTQQVALDGYYSNTLPVTSGVPQGLVLGHLLFLCYINDLPEGVSSYCHLYADDVLLYRNIEGKNDCLSLQADLNALQEWEQLWQVKFNPSKCHCISFSNSQTPIKLGYTIHNNFIQNVDSIKYLGVTIDQRVTDRTYR